MTNRELIEANRDKLLAWAAEGKSYFQMAMAIGINDRNASAVSQWFVKQGIRRKGQMTKGDAIIGFVKDYQRENGYAPSIREIALGVGEHSTSHVHYWLQRLEREGRIGRGKRIPRALVVYDRT